MLTLEKLKVYESFRGDIDGLARSSIATNRSVMTDSDWYLIDELMMGLDSIASGLSSDGFIRQLEDRIIETTADDQTRIALRSLAAQRRLNP